MAPVIQSKGPKEWNLLELRLAKAIGMICLRIHPIAMKANWDTDVGKVKEPDLNINGKRQPLLKIFGYEHWQVNPEELEVLKPSIQLASNLVRVGMPYIASFLPSRKEMFNDGELLDRNGLRKNLCPTEITLKNNPNKKEVAAALESLENLDISIKWQINNEMFAVSGQSTDSDSRALGWMGITRLTDEPRPWGPISDEMLVGADAVSMSLGLDRRPLIIGIMGEYVKTIKNSPKNSEQRLRATFMAGITMAHEVGHAMFHQDFRSYNPPSLEEPYVGKDCSAELGIAFIKWIFDGFHPNPASLRGHKLTDYTAHLEWTEHYDTDIDRRPLYKTLYSISVPWIEEKLTQGWWDSLPSARHLIEFSSKAKKALKPIISSASVDTATARMPEWVYSWVTGNASWNNDFSLRKRGYRHGEKVEGLTEEEIAWVKANQPLTRYDANIASKSPEEQAQIQRRARLIGLDDSEDEEEEVFMGGSGARQASFGFAPAAPNDIVVLDSNDGILEKNFSNGNHTMPLTDIVVRYLPEEEASTKRTRDGDQDQNGVSIKRAKLHSRSTEADKFLDRSSAFALATTMTRIEIHNMCMARKIPGFAQVQPTEDWQQSHPNFEDDPEDFQVPLALSNDMIEAAVIHLFPNDVDAQIQLKEASLDTVSNWGWPQIRQFCETNGLEYEGAAGGAEVRNIVSKFKRDEIEDLRLRSVQFSSLPHDPVVAANNPVDWTLRDLQDFCTEHNLPTTGTLTSMRIRVKRWQHQKSHGSFPRRTQLHRLDGKGFEIYTFRAHLGASTVGALKSALYIAGDFPPEAVLTLFFRDQYYHALQEDLPLLAYNTPTPDWTTLRLKVASKWKPAPGSTLATAIDVDARQKAKFSTPFLPPGGEVPSAALHFPVITYGSEPTPADIIAAARADPRTKREADVILKGANPTFSELLSSVGMRAPRLDQMLLAGGKFQRKAGEEAGLILSQSGMEIFEEVEDYEDEKEEMKRRLQAVMESKTGEKVMEGGGKRKRDPLEGYPPLGASHMADLLYATSKKLKRGRDSDAEY
ncbi:hypothetical protein D0Z07_4349 [Hyphodiscus hymeniophilus]|uniref:Uncharacterized protein n=1 Tax=Hyphodiscus hymeniophilus TaxID=353542 RepID=A0A9P6VJV0_9HELO|nr:hypothetical protein D0Z07_4349 [Hyphodiscus hymeniophilus]